MNHEAYPIHYIEHHDQRLYVELIQTVETRQIAWVRPLMLLSMPRSHGDGIMASSNPGALDLPGLNADSSLTATAYDLQGESDVLCPRALLREALDTEFIPLLSATRHPTGQSDRGCLRDFFRQICSEHPELFARPNG